MSTIASQSPQVNDMRLRRWTRMIQINFAMRLFAYRLPDLPVEQLEAPGFELKRAKKLFTRIIFFQIDQSKSIEPGRKIRRGSLHTWRDALFTVVEPRIDTYAHRDNLIPPIDPNEEQFPEDLTLEGRGAINKESFVINGIRESRYQLLQVMKKLIHEDERDHRTVQDIINRLYQGADKMQEQLQALTASDRAKFYAEVDIGAPAFSKWLRDITTSADQWKFSDITQHRIRTELSRFDSILRGFEDELNDFAENVAFEESCHIDTWYQYIRGLG
ncbi:hypothetical protein T440DRAFT_552887 [Plenodomus tracheiphilus IPT5]|uniref:Uncharacterized protein n=1 Tax=Plenodomus tracheiphilus IPT5 TaxID=1408161 RepID=A0A6A7BCK2_9PLEO|nr:hypothetical protein T440DRAFT_552887 [Plenodomus tracheiphilus IPT5]